MENRWFPWIPRALAILFALFTGLFSLDVFQMNLPWYQVASALFVHNIPLIIIALVLWLSWKHPLVGSISFGIITLVLAFIVRTNGYISTLLLFTFPPMSIALLFLLEYIGSRKQQKGL